MNDRVTVALFLRDLNASTLPSRLEVVQFLSPCLPSIYPPACGRVEHQRVEGSARLPSPRLGSTLPEGE